MTFPNLTDVRGAFTIISSKDSILDECGKLQSLSGSGNVIKGKLVCKGACTDIEDDPAVIRIRLKGKIQLKLE